MNFLKPIICESCGGAVPLLDAVERPCPYCRKPVLTPPQYLEALGATREAARARALAEPKWKRLASGSSSLWEIMGAAAMVVVPPMLTAFAHGIRPALASAAVLSLFTLPAIIPGAVVFLWGVTANATRERYRTLLAAQPPPKEGQLPGCRQCGAPLDLSEGALSSTCLYCGTDSLVDSIPTEAMQADKDMALRSLADATHALLRRLWQVGLSLVGTGVLLAGLSIGIYGTLQLLQ